MRQNTYFSASCTCREDFTVEVITPKVGEPTAVSGAANCALLKTLKTSARNWKPRELLRQRQVGVPPPRPEQRRARRIAEHAGAGATKQLVSNQRCTVGSSSVPSQTRLGRLPNAVPDWLFAMLMPSG